MLNEGLMLAASLLGVLLTVAAVRWLGLGGEHERIIDAAHAIRLAEEAECGFGGVAASVDGAGYGALVRNADGAVMLIRAHGNRFAARRIVPGWQARLDRDQLSLTADEGPFGSVTLQLGAQAAVEAARLRSVLS